MSSAPPPPPTPVSFSSPVLSSFHPPAPRFLAPAPLTSFSGSSVSAFPTSSHFRVPLVAPVSSASPFPSLPVSSLPQAQSLAPSLLLPFGASRLLPVGAPGLPQVASLPGVPGSSGVTLASAILVHPLAPAPSLFRPFTSVYSISVPISSAPPSVTSSGRPHFSSCFAFDSSSAPPDPSSSFSFSVSDDLPEDAPVDALPRVFDPVSASAHLESVRSEFRRMMAFIVDLFPQDAGSPSVPPPPRALFEDFFFSSVPPPPPTFLNWFERIRSALPDADSHLASFVASGRGDYLFLPSWSSTYAVHGDFAFGGAAPVNPSLLPLFERRLKPHHVGLTIREAAALEASLRSQSEAFSHSMWMLSALLGFVRLQNFALEDSSLFNTLVTSLSKSLAHQASLTVTHTAFVGLKRHEFYLSHLPAYFSDVNKRAMLSSPVVLLSSLFSNSDVTHLLEGTQTSSSLRSQQALVEVAGARPHRSSPLRSPSSSSPARRKRRESGSPSRSGKRVRFDSPAPSSALKGPKSGFRRRESCPSSAIGGVSGNAGRFGSPGEPILGSWRS